MVDRQEFSAGKVFLILLAFAVVGIPMFAFLWDTLNQVLTGYFEPWRLMVAAPVLLLFIGLFVLLGRLAQRWS